MKIYLKELKLSRKSLIIWTSAITGMLIVCLWMFPYLKDELGPESDLFANLGKFTAAFGMDKLNFGTLIGFYGIECGNILGMGGGMFAALLGIYALAKEAKERTAEFLLTHPVSRLRVLNEKLASVLTQIILLNAVIIILSILGILSIGEKLPATEFFLIHVSFLILQLEIACLCFGISAFVKRAGVGAGIGFALMLYFFNIISNIAEKADFLKYITPYAYCEASEIVNQKSLDGTLIILGIAYAGIALAAGYYRYMNKDIAA